MSVTSPRSYRVSLLLAFLVLVGALFLFAQPEAKSNPFLENLLNGASEDLPGILSSLPDSDLPLAMGVAEALKFRALHGDTRLSPERAEEFRQSVEKRLGESKTVSLKRSAGCPYQIPAHEVSYSGQKVVVPAHFRATISLAITDYGPQGEAGSLFPDLWVSFVTEKPPVKATISLDGRPVGPTKIDSERAVFRPPLTAADILPIGTHTASVLISDAAGKVASSAWSFTIGLNPVASPVVPDDAVVVATITVPIESLIPGANASGTVSIVISQAPDGRRFFEYSMTCGGVTQSTRSLYLLASILKNPRNSRGLTISPKTQVLFPNIPLTYTFSCDGPGTVIDTTWFVLGFVASSSIVHAPSASVVFTGRNSTVTCEVTVRVPAPGQTPPYVDDRVRVLKKVYPISVYPNPETTQLLTAKAGQNVVVISSERNVSSRPTTGAIVSEKFTEGQIFPLGESGILTVTRATWRLVGENTNLSIEFPTASRTRLVFGVPGVAELVHDVAMALTWEGESYNWTFIPEKSSLVAYFPVMAQTRFEKFPTGIIGGTSRQIKVKEYEIAVAGQQRIVTPATGIRFDPPWVLAQAQVFPISPPLAINRLYPNFVVMKPDIVGLSSEDGFNGTLAYDGAVIPDSQIRFRLYFAFFALKRPARYDPDTVDWLVPASEWLNIAAYPSPADLVDVEITPSDPPPLPEGQTLKFEAALVPKPNLGEGRIDKEGGTMSLLEGYEVTGWEPPSWNAILGNEVVQTLAQTWEFPFTSQINSGTYLIKAETALKVKEKDTGELADVKGSGQVSVNAVPGLKIKSPRQDLTYPKDWVAKVVTTLDSEEDRPKWKTLKWFVNGTEVKPNTDAPPWDLELNKVGTWTLKVSLPDPSSPQIELASDTVTFQVKLVSVSITPTRKVVAFAPRQAIDLQATVELNGHQLPKPGEYGDWGSKWRATVKNVEWKAVTEKPGCADLKTDQGNLLEAKATFTSPGAATALATVTIQLEPLKASKKNPPEIFVLPAVRADMWAVLLERIVYKDHFPLEAIQGGYRSFALLQMNLVVQGKPYTWSAPLPENLPPPPNSNEFPIVLPPALLGASAICNEIKFSWSGPSDSPKDAFLFTPFFATAEPEKIILSTTLVFDAPDEIPLFSKTALLKVWPLIELIQANVVPASFTIPFSGTKNLWLYVSPRDQPQETTGAFVLAEAFRAEISRVGWEKDGKALGSTNSHPYDQANGTGTIKVVASISISELDFKPPAPDGEGLVSAFSVANTPPITEIRIRESGSHEDLISFTAGYRKITTIFEAVGFSHGDEIGPVSVDWLLEGGGCSP